MSLATCPYCGTVFATKEGGCTTCTYRLPTDQIPAKAHLGAEAMERTGRWFKHVAEIVHEALPYHHHPH